MAQQCRKERPLLKNRLSHTEKWYEHVPEVAVENKEEKVLWDINVQCDNITEARRPDTFFDQQERAKGDNHQHCCTSRCKSRGKRNRENGKVPGLKERDWKIVET